MIGVHRSSISSLKAKPVLDPASKQGKLALLLIDIYRAGDPEWINYFMNSFNEATKGVPIELIQSINGLVKVLHFLTQIGEKYPA